MSNIIAAPGLVDQNGVTLQEPQNIDGLLLINAVGVTTSQTSDDQVNLYGRGVVVWLNMINAGTGSVTLNIRSKDPVSGLYLTQLSSAAIGSNGFTHYTVYPGIATVANIAASDVITRSWAVTVTAGNANPTTYIVSASVML